MNMGIESGLNSAKEAAAKVHGEKMERQRIVGAKVAGIRNNLGETRSEAEIRAQAEQEADAGGIHEVPAPSKEKAASESALSLFEFIKLDESDRDPSGRLTAEAKDRAKEKALDLTPDLLIKLLVEAADRRGENWDVYEIAEHGLLHGDNHEILKDFPEVQEYLDVSQRLIELPIEYSEDEIADEMGELREEQQKLERKLTNYRFINGLHKSIRAFLVANQS